jgi:hypothetical protein
MMDAWAPSAARYDAGRAWTALLRTQPVAVIVGLLYENPFFVQP